MNEGDPKKGKREITYQVGWKRGRLEIGENGKVTGGHSEVVFLETALWRRVMERFVWRELPLFPESVLHVVLWLLPLVSFLLIWLTVYLLMNG